jgi:hypothetical protein
MIRILIERILPIALFLLVFGATATSIVVFIDGHVGGFMLLVHMVASSGLVFAMPIFALLWLFRCLDHNASGSMERWGYWLMIVTGLLTIITVFVCMLPFPSTEQMETLITLHGYAGFAMVPALVVLLIGSARWRRIRSTRSATPG